MKKAEFNSVVMLIIAIVGVLFFLNFIVTSSAEASSFVDRQLCLTGEVVSTKQKGLARSCPVDSIEFTHAGIEINGEITSSYGKQAILDSNKINLAVADQMVNCWKRLAEGRLKDAAYDAGQCTICAEIEFVQNDKDEYVPTKIINLHETFRNSRLLTGDRQLYEEYFKTNNDEFVLEKFVVPSIEKDTKYAIINGKFRKVEVPLTKKLSAYDDVEQDEVIVTKESTALIEYKDISKYCPRLI